MIKLPNDFPARIITLDMTHSTNSYLEDLALRQELPNFTIVQTEFQTAGRGQRGNTWEAENGKNLLFSILLLPSFLEAKRQFHLSQIVSLAIKEELEQYIDNVSIKWPNDIYWKDKKICGILIENDLCGCNIQRSIAGIGLNINQDTFTSPAPNPISLKQITHQSHDRGEILKGILLRLQKDYKDLEYNKIDGLLNRYTAALFRKDGFHTYKDKDGIFEASIDNIEADGCLILKDEGGNSRRYRFKEVEYIL